MKIVSFAIPCYNSEGYMSKCIESLLPGGEDVEIIIVDDSYFDSSEYDINSFVKNINVSYYTYADYTADYDTKYRADIGGYYGELACKGFFFFLAAICITTPIVRLITDKFF